MLKKFFGGSMQRLFLYIVAVCILGIVLIGIYSYRTVSAALFEEIEKNSLLQMQRAGEKMETLEKSLNDVVFLVENSRIVSGNFHEGQAVGNEIFSEQIQQSEYIVAGFMKTSDGKEYTYNPNGIDVDMVQLQIFCKTNTAAESLQWYNGVNENYIYQYENYFIVSTSIPENENKYAILYMFVPKNALDDVVNGLRDKNNVVTIFSNGKLLAVNDRTRLNEITQSTLSELFRFYETEAGFFKFQKYNKRYITAHFQIPNSKFKFLAIYERADFYQEGYKILKVMIFIMGFFLLLILCLYHSMKSQYINPLDELAEEMKKTDYEHLNDPIPIRGSGEIAVLVKQYNEMKYKIHSMLEDIRKQEEMKQKAEITALRYQINPHFFYNTLSNVKLMAMAKGQKEISTTISKFSNMYRYLFSNKSNFVKIGEEIEFIQNYISLMSGRYDNRLNTFYLVEEYLKEYKMPVFLLQPIVENAIVHGLSKKLNEKKDCFLRISVRQETNMLIFEVEDDGSGIAPDKIRKILSMLDSDTQEFGLGLYNTISRLKFQYGNHYRFGVESQENEYTKIMIAIPQETE